MYICTNVCDNCKHNAFLYCRCSDWGMGVRIIRFTHSAGSYNIHELEIWLSFPIFFYLCRISLCPSYFCCKHYLEWSSSGFYGGRIVLMFLKLRLSLCSLYNNQRYLLKINIISCCSTAYSILLPSELNSYILLHLEVQLWCRVIAPLQLHSCTFFSVSYARHSTDLFILFEHISLVSLFKIFLN